MVMSFVDLPRLSLVSNCLFPVSLSSQTVSLPSLWCQECKINFLASHPSSSSAFVTSRLYSSHRHQCFNVKASSVYWLHVLLSASETVNKIHGGKSVQLITSED